ncbi:MAG: hypothetical protein Q9N02_01410, partial [Ghiorsea sp.]|nr:hypothetical protein [Ghiorsea sp.]
DTLTFPYTWFHQEKIRRLSGDYQGNNQFCSIFISFYINNEGEHVGHFKTENKENIVSNKNIYCEACKNVTGYWYIENDAIAFHPDHSWNNEYFMFNNSSTKLIYKGSKLRHGDTYNSSLCKKDLSLKKLGAL